MLGLFVVAKLLLSACFFRRDGTMEHAGILDILIHASASMHLEAAVKLAATILAVWLTLPYGSVFLISVVLTAAIKTIWPKIG